MTTLGRLIGLLTTHPLFSRNLDISRFNSKKGVL